MKNLNNPWRRLAIATYAAPKDSRIYGTFEADVTAVMEYIAARKQAGQRLSITHFVCAAIARTLYEDIPEINCYVRRGGVVPRENADVFVSINVGGHEMTGMVIRKCQELSATEIAEILQKAAQEKRAGVESGAFAAKDKLVKIPWPFRRWLFLLIKWWLFDLGLPFPFLKIPPDPFGSIMLTNIGTFGLQFGMVALFPIGRLPAVITMGRVIEKPVVIDGEIRIRSILPLTGTFDHRIVDGAQAGILTMGAMRRIQNPAELDRPNRSSQTVQQEQVKSNE